VNDDERKKDGDGGQERRSRRITPALGLPSAEATVRTLEQLEDRLRRALGVVGAAKRVVREDGRSPRSRALMSEAGDNFADLSTVAAGTGRAMKRFAQSQQDE
jgi:hypothetical protein